MRARARGPAAAAIYVLCVVGGFGACASEAAPERQSGPSTGNGQAGFGASGAGAAGFGNPGVQPGGTSGAGSNPVGGSGNSGGSNASQGGNNGGAGNGGSGNSGGSGDGSSGNGGSGNAGSGSAGTGEPPPAGSIGGYITSGDWKGFAWTATSMNGGSILPKDFGAAFDFPLCANGMVMAGDSNVAMVGWNLNQSSVDGEPALMVTPSLAGVTVAISNKGGSELRLQLQGQDGANDPNQRWCAVIPGSGGFIPYDAFNTECWAGGDGKPYNKEPIVAAIVLVPGKAGAPVNFDFCVTDITETDENGMAASPGCSLSGSPGEGGGTISGSDTRVVTRDGRQYVVQNNVWNGDGSKQSLQVTGTSFSVASQGNSASTGGAPTSFPSVFIGSNFGHSSSGSGLPKQVSALSKVQTGWKWSGSGGVHNAAYDVWFSNNAGGDGGNPSGAYLMVWFQHDASVVPLGGGPTGTVSIANKSWQYWVCSGGCQNGVPVISYVPPSGSINEWSFDLKAFIDHAVMVGVIKKEWYLSNVFAGFEIWSGGQGLKSESFCAVVN